MGVELELSCGGSWSVDGDGEQWVSWLSVLGF